MTTDQLSPALRMSEPINLQPDDVSASAFIFIRHEYRYYKIMLSDILYLEARRNYCKVMTLEKAYMVLGTLKQCRAILPESLFCQIHRAFVVAISHIESFDNQKVWLRGEGFAVGESYRRMLLGKVLVMGGAGKEIMKETEAEI